MSGMLGQLLGGMMGQGGQSSLVGVLEQVLTTGGSASGGGGGIAALVTRFAAAGLGPQAQSWVGTGTNQPVTPDQVNQVFTPQEISQWAAQAGTTPDKMSQVLSEALPHAVDHLTPSGQVPAQTSDVSGMLRGLLGQLGGTRQT